MGRAGCEASLEEAGGWLNQAFLRRCCCSCRAFCRCPPLMPVSFTTGWRAIITDKHVAMHARTHAAVWSGAVLCYAWRHYSEAWRDTLIHQHEHLHQPDIEAISVLMPKMADRSWSHILYQDFHQHAAFKFFCSQKKCYFEWRKISFDLWLIYWCYWFLGQYTQCALHLRL